MEYTYRTLKTWITEKNMQHLSLLTINISSGRLIARVLAQYPRRQYLGMYLGINTQTRPAEVLSESESHLAPLEPSQGHPGWNVATLQRLRR